MGAVIDPFTIAFGAISAIKSGVAMYKEYKALGKEVSSIAMEISGGIAKFFDAQGQVKELVAEQKKNPPKSKSLKTQAMETVVKQIELERQAAEMRQFLIYEADASFNEMWNRFEAELNRLTREKDREEANAKKKHNRQAYAVNRCGIGGRLGLLCLLPSLSLQWRLGGLCGISMNRLKKRKKTVLAVRNLKNDGLRISGQKNVGWNINQRGKSPLIA
jgi:hypothetical protein